jgi:putative ABC transport system ATP-binding protein
MKDITKIFHTGGIDFVALNNISVDFYAGEFISVVGKSGSGKSTLANMLTGIDHPTQGSVTLAGIPIHNLKESPMSIWRGKNLGIVFQFYQLLSTLTLVENVMLPMDFCSTYPQTDREPRARDLLDMVGLADFADKLPAAVSGGQQQTAAIARALANDPPILIADEPTGNLDSKTAEAVFELFSNLVVKGKTVVMVTHDPGLAARTDRVVHIHDGRLVQEEFAGTTQG